MIESPLIDAVIDIAFKEDIGDGDHTTLSCIPHDLEGRARLLVKQDGILCGVELAKKIFEKFDPTLKMNQILHDGDSIKKGDIAFTVEGKTISILQTERLVLNFMQRLSGIATQTHEYVKLLEGTNTKILDTRKTTPGLRLLEKYAVKIGGGENHRIGLYDMILIKDNHIDYAGGVTQAITKTKEYLKAKGKDLKIEVEARTLAEIEEILKFDVERILIDNFTPEETKKAVALINGKCKTESSGGITKESIRAYAEAGVDYISVGALTHHISSLDLSLKAY
ncbi:MAG: carboxylating nicotinate-nucleotide diphosphorylase [Bacteroidales bacterium]|nr:carboxylating nicotinate-nucleotide diphosphorylase [Bacteroidales bacterium]MBQ4215692.1 carboxylating nicotinate-nucleotide diphosphorylase [Bacteroidales bacterium]MBR4498167.1 carboxylating nicotinate-nucleotide diphosphorylase [Bacteroidales bacterium]MBR7035800.1 carboxylating nicotinate-nucleotide diphosphorylase [Bacteroidales bacterium]